MAIEQKGNLPIDKMFDRLKENKYSWHLTRIPEETKKYIIDLANKEYCGDYGMAIKGIVDSIPSQDILTTLAMIESLEQRVSNLEELNSSEKPEESKEIRMCDGSKKSVK